MIRAEAITLRKASSIPEALVLSSVVKWRQIRVLSGGESWGWKGKFIYSRQLIFRGGEPGESAGLGEVGARKLLLGGLGLDSVVPSSG